MIATDEIQTFTARFQGQEENLQRKVRMIVELENGRRRHHEGVLVAVECLYDRLSIANLHLAADGLRAYVTLLQVMPNDVQHAHPR